MPKHLKLLIAMIVGYGFVRIHHAATHVLSDGDVPIVWGVFGWIFGGCVGVLALCVIPPVPRG